MSIPAPPRMWSALSPDEKLHRLTAAFTHDSITLDEFEERVEEALLEEQAWDRKGIGVRAPGKRVTL